MIRKVLLSTVAIVAVSGTAFAADLPSRRAPPVYVPPPIPVFTWTGFYVGGDIGYAFGRDRATTAGFGTYNVGKPNGTIGGAHLGYNFSSQSLPLAGLGGVIGGGGGLVLGVEADVTGSNFRGQDVFAGAAGTTVVGMHSYIQGSLRGRIGVAVDRALFYATGGAALAQFDTTYIVAPAGAATTILNPSHQRIGYAVGGGMEYAISTAFSVRGQYIYSDYGHFYDGGVATSHNVVMQRATVGFSYKFDSPVAAPVVARY